MNAKPKNKSALNPLLKKGHAHQSTKDYDRKKLKKDTQREVTDSKRQSND